MYKWMLRSLIGGIVLVGAFEVKASPPTVTAGENLRSLGEIELRAVLNNVSLRPYGAPHARDTETFHRNGEYARWRHRIHRRGRFWIAAGRVCVLLEVNQPECFHIYRDEGGTFWRDDSGTGEPFWVEIVPIGNQTLDTAELQLLLRNVTLRHVFGPGIHASGHQLERFYQTGEYVQRRGRGGRTGTFSITGGQVCVSLSGTEGPDCFRLQRDGGGRYWKIDSSGVRTQVEISSME